MAGDFNMDDTKAKKEEETFPMMLSGAYFLITS